MRLVLISMPWAIFNRPSIQLSALKAYIHNQDQNITVDTRHPYLDAAERIGRDAYQIISRNNWAGEALYCGLLFPQQRNQAETVFQRSLGHKTVRTLPDFDTLAARLDTQLDDWLERQDFQSCDLVGFSICFSQLPATLLAARRLKKIRPDLLIVLGGSTCAPDIGNSLLNVFPELDFIITGEGERPLLNLCQYLAGEKTHPGPNVLQRVNRERTTHQAEDIHPVNTEIADLNTLPLPDFDDYFAELKQTNLTIFPTLPIEFSRGCWWNKCAFCNLNLQWCGYRSKSSERMLRDVESLHNRYQSLDFIFTDNALPPKEADRFFTALQKNDRDIHFFAEIRALKNPESYSLYHRGGLRSVQIGIEALSDSLLKRMNKGIQTIDNIAAIKFATASGLNLEGNLILEFPGSTAEEVDETMDVLDFILPYQPLLAAAFFLGHGSPVWKAPRRYGVTAILHHPYNRKLYPAPVLARLNMLINSGRGDRRHQKKLWQPVRKKMQAWNDFHNERENSCIPLLSYRDGDDFLIIRQERAGQAPLQHRLTGLSRRLYLACNQPTPIKKLIHLSNSITEDQLSAFLNDLEQKRLLFRDRDRCLALAVRQS